MWHAARTYHEISTSFTNVKPHTACTEAVIPHARECVHRWNYEALTEIKK